MRTLIYARYSSHLQLSRSIEDQIRACEDRATAEGWTILGAHTDAAISGAAGMSEAQRPGLNALLARVEAGGIDQVLCDTTSRIARNQGDAHHIRDRLNFHGTRLFTLADGEIDAFKGAIKGLLDEQQRKELAHNIRRAQRGRVAEGRAPAGIAYGYRSANRLDDRGRLVAGLRAIDPDQAEIVVRIFAEYVAGRSAIAIAEGLNADRIPGPRGGLWRASTIGGNPKRGDGILRNRLYAGVLVHFRTTKVQDPRTRATVIRPKAAGDQVEQSVPELRIVDPAIWDAAQRQLAERSTDMPEYQRRPKRLLSGLGQCGVCGSGWISKGDGFWICAGTRNGAKCSNTRKIEQRHYERRVLAGLRDKMLDPEAVALYLREYHQEDARRAREEGNSRANVERKLSDTEARISRLVRIIADGGAEFQEFAAELTTAKERRAILRAELDAIEGDRVIALHPTILADYQRQVDALNDALSGNDTPEARDIAIPKLRAIIDTVIITPAPGPRGVEIEVTGHLLRMLELATGRSAPQRGVTLERVRGIEPPS